MRTLTIATTFCLLGLFSRAQNVGIGTTNPKVKLHVLRGNETVAPYIGSTMAVQSDGETFLQILSNSLEDQNGIVFGNTNQPISAGITFNSFGSNDLSFYTNASAPTFTINSQGNIGIRTFLPKAAFHVNAYRTVLFGDDTSGAGSKMIWYAHKSAMRIGRADKGEFDNINCGNNSFATGLNTKAIGEGSFASGDSSIAAGGTSTAMGNGNHANGYGSVAMGSYSNASGTNSTAMGWRSNANSSNSIAVGESVTNNGYGSIVMGRYNDPIMTIPTNLPPAPTEPLLIVGNGTTDMLRSNALVILQNGNATLAGTLTQSSDARLKINITRLRNQTKDLLQLNGYTYNWKGNNRDSDQQIGFLAQEVQKVYPQLVKQSSTGDLSVNYIGLIPVLLEGLKEQQKQIAELQRIVKKLIK